MKTNSDTKLEGLLDLAENNLGGLAGHAPIFAAVLAISTSLTKLNNIYKNRGNLAVQAPGFAASTDLTELNLSDNYLNSLAVTPGLAQSLANDFNSLAVQAPGYAPLPPNSQPLDLSIPNIGNGNGFGLG